MRRSVLSHIWRSGPFLYPDKSPQTGNIFCTIRLLVPATRVMNVITAAKAVEQE